MLYFFMRYIENISRLNFACFNFAAVFLAICATIACFKLGNLCTVKISAFQMHANVRITIYITSPTLLCMATNMKIVIRLFMLMFDFFYNFYHFVNENSCVVITCSSIYSWFTVGNVIFLLKHDLKLRLVLFNYKL